MCVHIHTYMVGTSNLGSWNGPLIYKLDWIGRVSFAMLDECRKLFWMRRQERPFQGLYCIFQTRYQVLRTNDNSTGSIFSAWFAFTQSHEICEWVNTYHAISGRDEHELCMVHVPYIVLSGCLINGCTALVLMEKGTRVLTHPHFFPDPTLPKRKRFTSAGGELGKAFEVSGRPQRNALYICLGSLYPPVVKRGREFPEMKWRPGLQHLGTSLFFRTPNIFQQGYGWVSSDHFWQL